MKRRLLPFILAGALSAVAVAPAAAQDCATTNRGGIPGIVALVAAQVQAGITICHVDVDVLNNSLNNLLQNAEILNNSPILSSNDITVTVDDVLNQVTISVLGGPVITVGGF